MFKGTIEKKVMKAIRARISRAEKKYDEGVKVLEKELEDKKIVLEDTLVKEVLGEIK